jgi:hypothetical protein
VSDLLQALVPVAEVLDRLGVDYLLGGSIASSLRGTARATMDVDLVAAIADTNVLNFVTALERDYYVDAEMIREAIRDRSCFNLVHQGTMIKVDVFVPKGRRYDREAMSRRRRERMSAAGPEIPVATAEDVVLAKLEWFERGGRVSERQWDDILGVLRVQGEVLDAEYLARWAGELGVAQLLEKAMAEA